MKKIIMSILTAVIFSSCAVMTDEAHYEVSPELRVFVDRFYAEAESRGIYFDRDSVSIELRDNLQKTDLAYGVTYGRGSAYHLIFIDRQFALQQLNEFSAVDYLGDVVYDSAAFYTLEYVVFHECGHSFLNRGHVGDGHFSIMTGDGSYIGNFESIDADRQKLINELFDGH